MRRLTFFLFLFSASVVGFSSWALADPVDKGHVRKSPHGGILQEADGMHAELVIEKNGRSEVYLYDKAMKPLVTGEIKGRLVIKGHDGPEHTKDLKASKESKGGAVLQGEPIKGLADWDTAVASVKLKEQWVHFRFSRPHGEKGGH